MCSHFAYITVHVLTVSPQTKNLDFRGLDSSRFLVSRGVIPRSIGDFPEFSTQTILRMRILSVQIDRNCSPKCTDVVGRALCSDRLHRNEVVALQSEPGDDALVCYGALSSLALDLLISLVPC